MLFIRLSLMADTPFVICTRCCSLDIEGPEFPDDESVLRCRSCGHQAEYRVMRVEIEMAMRHAVLQIHKRVALRIPASASAITATLR
jgi:hypothetical protein